MRYDIIFAPQAVQDLKRLSARNRTLIRDTAEKYLRFEPDKVSQSRIKRLQGIRHPQYRLRVSEMRIFYDIVAEEHDERFLRRVTKARENLRAGQGIKLEELDFEETEEEAIPPLKR